MELDTAISLAFGHIRMGRARMAEHFLMALEVSAPNVEIVKALRAVYDLYITQIMTIEQIAALPFSLQQAYHNLEEIMSIIDKYMNSLNIYYALNETCMIPGLSQIYENVFGRKRNGVFVEIGAFDGRTQSNTDCFSPLGWSGLYVEPVEAYYQRCRQWHLGNQKIKHVRSLVGGSEGERLIKIGGVLSTASEALETRRRNTEWSEPFYSAVEKSELVSMTTLNNILNKENIPQCFDVLVVDTEGLEGEVFKGFNLEYWLPTLAIIELADQSAQFIGLEEIKKDCNIIRARLLASGYRIIYQDDTNTIFYHAIM